MGEELIAVERRGPVAVVGLRRPPVNALSGELLDLLEAEIAALRADRAVRALVLTGNERAFSAGADVREFAALEPGEATRRWMARGQRVCGAIALLDRPVVAAIEGYCLGGGLELALACHLRVAADGAQLGAPEIKLGIVPGFGGTQRLPRLIGRGAALELMLTGDPIGAEEASRIGLVTRIAPRGGALQAALDLAGRLAERSTSATAAILRLVDADLSSGLAQELDAVVSALASADGREGVDAFLAKRPARFD